MLDDEPPLMVAGKPKSYEEGEYITKSSITELVTRDIMRKKYLV